MRWDDLISDLETQAEALSRVEQDMEIAERTRAEIGQLRLVDRLRPAIGHLLQLRCLGAGALQGRVDRLGSDWVLLVERPGREAVVALAAVVSITGLGALSATPGSEGAVGARLGLRYVLRGVARNRSAVQLTLLDGVMLAGTLDRVGADFVELAEHPADALRRPEAVLRVRTVPLTGVAVVRSR